MKIILSYRRLRYVARACIFLITVALIAGIVGCGGVIEFEIDPDTGEILEDITFTSPDGMLTVTIPEGTIALDKDDNPLLTLRVDNEPDPPAPPEGAHIIGLAYDFDPAGTTFDPAMTWTWKYSPADIPEGIDEEDLVIAYYDEASGEWVILESVVDKATNTIAASVSHLTTFATIAIPSVQYDLTTSSTAGGSVTTPGEGIFTYDEGTVVDLVAEAEETYYFINWTGDVGTIGNINAASNNITMNGDYSITANFEQIPPGQFLLTTSSTTGGSVTVPGEGTFTYDEGTVVNLVAESEEGYRFVNWTGDVGTIGNINAASTTITMNGHYSITANFMAVHDLIISSTAGGSVTTPGEGTSTYDEGTVVNLVATPTSGYSFVNWTGDVGTIANVYAASTTITMNGDYSITANFIAQYDLTISSTVGGEITTPGEGTSTYNEGTVVNLVATPTSGYRFVNWTGDVGTIANVNADSTTITMNGDYSITANFVVVYDLTISSTSGGSVTTPGEGTSTYDEGTVVNLVATPTSGYRFVNWIGDVGEIANINAASTTITMNGDYSITANFVAVYDLTISSTTGGSVTTPGEVVSTYDQGTVVNLVATPDAYCYFVNWTGDVGTVANLNAASTTIIMNGDYSITANFEEEEAVIFPDPNLEAAIREKIGKPTGPIYPSDLEGLTSLSAFGKSIADLTGLEHCTSLTYLDLCSNQISNISPLSSLTNLTKLHLNYNQVSNISPLASLTNLTLLWLRSNQISNISPLSNLTSLGSLYLSENQISDISPLANLTSLGGLYLSENQISDISPLANLTSLRGLHIQWNQISNISPLSSLTSLEHLWLGYNQLSDISPLANLTNLTWLLLHNNQISDISPLVNNPGLAQGDTVNLAVNPLSDTSINIYIPQLEARGVIVTY